MKRVLPAAAHDPDAQADGLADPSFAADLIAWQRQHGRHSLPWQNTTDAYRIWLSEIMLQQTQVAAVIPYYRKFLLRFPNVDVLAAAPAEDVMAHWSGLGYYSRARNLHRCAQQVVTQHAGIFPADPAALAELPGIGRSTAAAITAFAYGTRAAIMDGNVKRVFARVFGIDTYPGERRTEEQMWKLAVGLLPPEPEYGNADANANAAGDPPAGTPMQSYTQGLMDLGATLCIRSRPACERCPLAARCVALATGRTATLPVRKPSKATPQKHAVMLVVTHGDEVLLQRRPDSGIWGGLLSLPELDGFTASVPEVVEGAAAREAFEAAVARNLARFGEVCSTTPLQPFAHGFTHFKLHVVPHRVTLSKRQEVAGETDHVWLNTATIAAAPLPAPIKKLLLALFDRDDLFA